MSNLLKKFTVTVQPEFVINAILSINEVVVAAWKTGDWENHAMNTRATKCVVAQALSPLAPLFDGKFTCSVKAQFGRLASEREKLSTVTYYLPDVEQRKKVAKIQNTFDDATNVPLDERGMMELAVKLSSIVGLGFDLDYVDGETLTLSKRDEYSSARDPAVTF